MDDAEEEKCKAASVIARHGRYFIVTYDLHK